MAGQLFIFAAAVIIFQGKICEAQSHGFGFGFSQMPAMSFIHRTFQQQQAGDICFGPCDLFSNNGTDNTIVGQSECNPSTIENEIRSYRTSTINPPFTRGDAAGVSNTAFAPDIFFIGPGSPTARSRREMIGQLSQTMQIFNVRGLSLDRERYLCFGDYAVEVGKWALSGPNGAPTPVSGRDMVIWKKSNGVWLQKYSANVGPEPSIAF